MKLVAGDGAAGDQFGISVSLSGYTGLVGANHADVGGHVDQGAAYVFRHLDTSVGTVTQNVKLTASDGAAQDQFGGSTSLSGSMGLMGAISKTVGANNGQGAAYVFRNLDTATGTVTENVKLTASDGAVTGYFGFSVSLDEDRMVIGSLSGNGVAAATGTAYSGNVSSFTTMNAGNVTQTISKLSFVSQDDWIIGQTTSGNQLTLSAGDTGNVIASGKGLYIGKTTGSNNNALIVQGNVTTNQVTISAATGSTGNRLQIAETGSVSANSIAVNTGGTLLFSGSNSASNRIGNSTAISLAGGTFNTAGLSEGSTAAAGLGVLTLTANSILDLGAGSSVLHFARQQWADLDAQHDPSALTSTQLSQIRFYSDAGTTYLGSGIFAATNNGEVTYDAIPEPATVWSALGLTVMAVLDFRRRRGQLHRVDQINRGVRI